MKEKTIRLERNIEKGGSKNAKEKEETTLTKTYSPMASRRDIILTLIDLVIGGLQCEVDDIVIYDDVYGYSKGAEGQSQDISGTIDYLQKVKKEIDTLLNKIENTKRHMEDELHVSKRVTEMWHSVHHEYICTDCDTRHTTFYGALTCKCQLK